MIPTEQSQVTPRLIRAEEFRQQMGGISRATQIRQVKSGELPAPIKIGGCDFYEEHKAAEIQAQKRLEADARQAEVIAQNNENTEAQN
jgi:predicted DNA-binding transcriptional regulator AlpA